MRYVLGWLASWLVSAILWLTFGIEMKKSFFCIYTVFWSVSALYDAIKLSQQEPKDSPCLIAFAAILLVFGPMLFSWLVDKMVFPTANFFTTYMVFTSGICMTVFTQENKQK